MYSNHEQQIAEQYRTVNEEYLREFHHASTLQDGGVGFDIDRLFTRSLCTPKAVLQYGLYL